MKEIKAIIQPFMLSKVISALREFEGLPGVTVSDVIGFGKSRGREASEPLVLESGAYAKKTKLEIVIPEELVDPVVAMIADNAHTGNPGDGKIFVSTVDDVVKIRTGEQGLAAV